MQVSTAFKKKVGQSTNGKRKNTKAKAKGQSQAKFSVQDEGVFSFDADGNEIEVCSKLEILGDTRDERNGNWGRLLQWQDRDNFTHTWAMPMSLLSGDGNEYRARLLQEGLEIGANRKAKELLTQYIQTTKTSKKLRCVARVGWYGDVFVFPDETIGAPEHEIVYQPEYATAHKFGVKGTLEQWQYNISKYCAGNSHLTFGVSLAFASVILPKVEIQSGGFHNRGGTSSGKTTLSFVAGSVFGGSDDELGYCQSWKATANGLESIAETHNHSLLCLDELAQIDGRQAADVAYMLANGFGKSRMAKTITARRSLSWKLFFLSNGEISLADKINEAGLTVKGGQEVRVVDIPVAMCKFGVFDELHGLDNGQKFSDHLRSASGRYYGSPIREFLRKFIELDLVGIEHGWQEFHDKFIPKILPQDKKYPLEVNRVAARFALVAFAGETATRLGITKWRAGEATKAVIKVFRAWFDNRSGRGSSDAERALSQIRVFIEAHGASRFEMLNASDESLETIIINNRAGFRKRNDAGELEYLFLPEIFRKEVCKGFDYKFVCKVLDARGYLHRDSTGFQKQLKYGGVQIRPYWISPRILEDSDDAEKAQAADTAK